MPFNVTETDKLRYILAADKEVQSALFALDALEKREIDTLEASRYIETVTDPAARKALYAIRDRINGVVSDESVQKAISAVSDIHWSRTALGFTFGSIASNALAVLRKYGTDAHIWLPGVGVVNGLTAGNFSDTAGTTASIIDSTAGVGLVIDATNTLGSELVTNGTFDSNVTGWSGIGGGTLAWVSGEIQVTGGGNSSGARQVINTVAGRAYQITFTGRRGTTVQNLAVAFGTTVAAITTAGPETRTFIGIATAATTNLDLTISNAAATGTALFDNISVRELIGAIPASQGTTANKPILRRGAVNRLLQSATLSTQSVTVTAQPYTLAFNGTGTVTLSGASTAGPLVGTGASNRVSLTFTPTAGSLTLTVSGSVTSAQLETGSTASAYVPTTTAAASSPTGSQYWELDGTDFLTLSAVPFGIADNFVVVAALQSQSNAINGRVFSIHSAGSAVIRMIHGTDGTLSGSIIDDAGAFRSLLTSGTNLGTMIVGSIRHSPSVSVARRNGVAGPTQSTALGTGTLLGAQIGAQNGSSTFIGNIGPVIAIKGTVSDADLLTLERWVGSMSGVTIT